MWKKFNYRALYCEMYSLWPFLTNNVFTARCYASAVLAMAVCPSVCPSQVGVLLKRLNVGSHKQHHTIAQGLSFSEAKDLREIRPGSPLRGHQMQVGCVKIGDFPQITGYISKTVQDRRCLLYTSPSPRD